MQAQKRARVAFTTNWMPTGCELTRLCKGQHLGNAKKEHAWWIFSWPSPSNTTLEGHSVHLWLLLKVYHSWPWNKEIGPLWGCSLITSLGCFLYLEGPRCGLAYSFLLMFGYLPTLTMTPWYLCKKRVFSSKSAGDRLRN
jgi:hypothetical protein